MSRHHAPLGRFALLASLALAATPLAGCLGGDEGSGSRAAPTPSAATEYKLATLGVPAAVDPGTNFTFTLTITGAVTKASKHVGAHWGAISTTAAPSTAIYSKACVHQEGTVPGTFTVTCNMSAPGTHYLRGHLQVLDDGKTVNYWSDEARVRVKGFGPLGTVKVGTDATFPPFEEYDPSTQTFRGFDVDVMTEIGKRSNFTPRFENAGFDTLIEGLKRGEFRAAISSMSITANRSLQVDFSIPYYESNQSVSVRPGDQGKFKSLDDMKGKGLKIGAQSGTTGESEAVDLFGRDNVIGYNTYPLAIEALKRGDVAAVVMDAPAQREAAKTDGAVVIAFEFSIGDVYGIPVKKGDVDMLARINHGLAQLIADGTLAKLKATWKL